MHPLHTFTVVPVLPAPLERLRDIAYNLRWSWDHETIELFRRIDTAAWETSGHNPVRMLGTIGQERFKELARDSSFLAHLERVATALKDAMGDAPGWFQRTFPQSADLRVAYFSAEFGITECLSIFAGGLGMLAGDHLKSASELRVPLVGVSLLYQQGYFRQYLNQSGWQQEDYPSNDFRNLPVEPLNASVRVDLAGRAVTARIWKAQVGSVPLYLLDTNIPDNSREDRDITDQLYGGDLEMRIKQEILLGIGGYRALEKMGVAPTVCHMNEGHSAFLSLERTRRLMEIRGLSFAEARELACASLVFTGHTPVEAGHDYFPPELMDRYFSNYARSLGLGRDEFLGLGRRDPSNASELFCMTVLAIRMAAFSNGVSKLHGQVSRRMWQSIWPGVPLDEVPIGHVTNGVHFRSWISQEMKQLYDRYLGPDWSDQPGNAGWWKRADSIPAEELWRTHERRRERLVGFARRRLRDQLQRRGAPPSDVQAAEDVLDAEALTIGFARRFATYKRATLLLHDPERLARIVNDPQRPVQIIYAGKAHPRDEGGKRLISDIISLARRPEFRRRIVFLEDYDMAVARSLVQGCDVWLNTPLRPLEASGTSGMKAAANGALNLSTLDGWWDEAWRESDTAQIGWAIGNGEDYANQNDQDQVEAEALYNLLERDVVPAFYERGRDRLPRQWIGRMRASLSRLCWKYNTHRMVEQYTGEFYTMAHVRFAELDSGGAARARGLAAWKQRVRAAWPQVRIQQVEDAQALTLHVGDKLHVKAHVNLGELDPDDVQVELYMGLVDAHGELISPVPYQIQATGKDASGATIFEGTAATCESSGDWGFTVRVLPYHSDLLQPYPPGLIVWAG